MVKEPWSASAHDAAVRWAREDARATALAEVRDAILALPQIPGYDLDDYSAAEALEAVDNLSKHQGGR